MKIGSEIGLLTAFAACLLGLPRAHGADLLVPSQYPTIQSAIDAATAGDVVQISPGTYEGPIDTRGKPIVVRGVSSSSEVTISGGASVVRCVSGENNSTLIENLTITGGTAAPEISYGTSGFMTVSMRGAGVKVVGSSPVFRNCRIVANTINVSTPLPGEWCGYSDGRGAGVYVDSGSPRFEGCLIAGNSISSTSSCPGGVSRATALGGGVCLISSSAILRNCTITGNSNSAAAANHAYSSGAGVHVSAGGTPIVDQCTVTSNAMHTINSVSSGTCTAVGCGLACETPAQISGSIVSDNMITGCGGQVAGVQFLSVGSSMSGSRICSNAGTQVAGAYTNLGGNIVAATCPPCAGDLNGDGVIDGVDLGILLARWGACPN